MVFKATVKTKWHIQKKKTEHTIQTQNLRIRRIKKYKHKRDECIDVWFFFMKFMAKNCQKIYV